MPEGVEMDEMKAWAGMLEAAQVGQAVAEERMMEIKEGGEGEEGKAEVGQEVAGTVEEEEEGTD